MAESTVKATVRYYLHNDQVEGLTELIAKRNAIMLAATQPWEGRKPYMMSPEDRREEQNRDERARAKPAEVAREAWEAALTKFWLNHPLLSRFDRKEWRFDLGCEQVVRIICEDARFSIDAGTFFMDHRLASGHVAAITIDDCQFERLTREPDLRGRYVCKVSIPRTAEPNDDAIFGILGLVTLKDGRYSLRLQAQVNGTFVYLLMRKLTEFGLDIIRGAEKPLDNETVTQAVPTE